MDPVTKSGLVILLSIAGALLLLFVVGRAFGAMIDGESMVGMARSGRIWLPALLAALFGAALFSIISTRK